MISSNPANTPSHNTDKPPLGSQYESVRKPWDLVGRYTNSPGFYQIYSPIGKRLLVTAQHIGAWIGQPIEIQGLTVHVVSFENSPARIEGETGAIWTPELVYCTVDQDIPEWFTRYTDEPVSNASHILIISGGPGGTIQSDPEGWPFIQSDEVSYAVRWGICHADYIGEHSLYPPNPVQPDPPPWISFGCFLRHHDAGHPETVGGVVGDSGGAAFVNCGPADNPWVFLGSVNGGGSYLSPYKGDVQTGMFGACTYHDNEWIAEKNGETPAPPEAPLPTPAKSSLRRVLTDVNTAVIVYDYQTAQWQPIHRGTDLAVREWFVMTVDGIERLCCVTEDGFLNLYEESDAGDQVFSPGVWNHLSLEPIAVSATTRGYTGGTAGFKAGQFARLVVATLDPVYSVATRTEGVSELASLVQDRARDHRTYDKPAGVSRWVPDNSNADFFTPFRQDYTLWLPATDTPLDLSPAFSLDVSFGVSLDLSPKPIELNLDKGLPVDLKQEANHPLRMVRQRGRWHQAVVENKVGILELRAVQLELQETDRQMGSKV
jgi:hypothetical protein